MEDEPFGSSLKWYVDIRCRGEGLPAEPRAARDWFLERAEVLRDGLERLAEAVSVGKDDPFPLTWSDFRGLPEGVRAEVVCSTIRRVTGHDLAAILRDIAARFVEFVEALETPVAYTA